MDVKRTWSAPGLPLSESAVPKGSSFDAAYVHVPFCRHRCGYCNFTLIAGRDDRIGDYLDALALELERSGPPTPVSTLFFGGGTPTHLQGSALARLFDMVAERFPTRPGAEVSVEANPRDLLDESRLDLMAARGVNRISLGVQSFSSRKLKLLERDHDAEIVREVVANCQARFASVSLDLIFGVPGETLSEWQSDLDQALATGVQHLSTYGLTFEKGTRFWSRREAGGLIEIDEDLAADCYEAAIDVCRAAGLEHYEVSNFARVGHRCRHNEVYWTDRPYQAVGPGASRYLDNVRETNHRSTTTWIARLQAGESPVAEREVISWEQRVRDRMVFGLRRLEGIDEAEFRAATDCDIDPTFGAPLRKYLEAGLLVREAGRLRLSRQGLLISDALWPDLLTNPDADA